MTDLVAARPKMIATLDSFRDTLENLGGDLGVTDPASGPVVPISRSSVFSLMSCVPSLFSHLRDGVSLPEGGIVVVIAGDVRPGS